MSDMLFAEPVVAVPCFVRALDPRIDHETWWQAQLGAGMTAEELRDAWRAMNSRVVLSDGRAVSVHHFAGASILLVEAVCMELGIHYRMSGGATDDDPVVLDTGCATFGRVMSNDSVAVLHEIEVAALSALRIHRGGTLGDPFAEG